MKQIHDAWAEEARNVQTDHEFGRALDEFVERVWKAGYSAGHEQGHDEGYKEGKEVGYDTGYNDRAEESPHAS